MTEPKLLVFVCHWCSLGAADQAGGLKLASPVGLRIVRVMCSGRIEPKHILDAYNAGADGVLVLGCHPGDCHYKEGNFRARNRVALLSQLLRQLGVDPSRLHIDWVGAGEGERFSRIVHAMAENLGNAKAQKASENAS